MFKVEFLTKAKALLDEVIFPWGFITNVNGDFFGVYFDNWKNYGLSIGCSNVEIVQRCFKFNSGKELKLEYAFWYKQNLAENVKTRKILAMLIKKTLLKKLDEENKEKMDAQTI